MVQQVTNPVALSPPDGLASPSSHGRATRFRLTRAGWYWLVAAAILWGTGLYKGINLLTLLATLMAVIVAANAFIAGRRLRQLRLRWWTEQPAFAQTPICAHLEVQNMHDRAQFGIRLDCRAPEQLFTWFLTRISGQDKGRFQGRLTWPRRGWAAGAPLQASSAYPFGLAERRVIAEGSEATLVFPRLGRLHRGRLRRHLLQVVLARAWARRRPCRHPAAQTEFHGLRQFRTGDSPRLIHWRTSARRGELMVREFEESPTDNLVLVLEPWLPEDEGEKRKPKGAREEANQPPSFRLSPVALRLEEAVSLAATICWEWCRHKDNRFVLAVCGHAPVVVDGVTGTELAWLLLECLALVRGRPAPDTERLVECLSRAALPPAPILVVSTRSSNLGDALAGRLRRPVTFLDMSAPDGYDFFERAAAHAR